MNTPQAGQRVWVCHLTIEDNRLLKDRKPAPRFVIREREFYRVIPNYCGEGLRWSVGPIGKASHENSRAPYGVAYLPADVHESADEARKALAAELIEAIDKLASLLNMVEAGHNEGNLETEGAPFGNPVLHSDNLAKRQGGAK